MRTNHAHRTLVQPALFATSSVARLNIETISSVVSVASPNSARAKVSTANRTITKQNNFVENYLSL